MKHDWFHEQDAVNRVTSEERLSSGGIKMTGSRLLASAPSVVLDSKCQLHFRRKSPY